MSRLQNEIEKAVLLFSKKERIAFYFLSATLVVGTFGMFLKINNIFSEPVPLAGGEISEGVVGAPRFVNPVLANSAADQDLSALVYSGLMRRAPDGSLIEDLAEKYEVSEDGLSYTFILKEKIRFHDGQPITAEDVVFTVNQVKNPDNKSPKSGEWDGVIVTKKDNRVIEFKLRSPYASFLHNTTLGILPARGWKDTPLELNDLNIKAIGSGPYRIKRIGKRDTGIVEYYELVPFRKHAGGKAHVEKLVLRFYANEEELVRALLSGEVKQAGSITPKSAEALKGKSLQVITAPLSRVFGLFFNQNQNQIFTDRNIITAIDLAIDRERIISEALLGYATPAHGPIPEKTASRKQTPSEEEREKARNRSLELIAKNGWKKGADGYLEKTTTVGKKKSVTKLEFEISTGNAAELYRAAEIVKEDLEKIGMRVKIKSFEAGNLNQSVIRPRRYDALLFGQIVSRESDLFAFWHSSQRKDPGLNVAMYTSAKADKLLEEAFILASPEKRNEKYTEFKKELEKDKPAVFLYTPLFVYVIEKNLKGFEISDITSPSDRFAGVQNWYLKTENVWKIFNR